MATQLPSRKDLILGRLAFQSIDLDGLGRKLKLRNLNEQEIVLHCSPYFV